MDWVGEWQSPCRTDKVIVKEIPEPTEHTMLVKLLMSLSERYELAGSTITVGLHEVRAVFRFPEHNLPKLREIMLEEAGMADVSKIPPRWAPSKRDARSEAMRRLFEE